jgi:hypothetical protein
MMTRDRLLKEMEISEAREENLYKDLTLSLFRNIQASLKDLYDETFTVTERFTSITPDVIRASPKVIKTLRYCLAPNISQMRLGQIIGGSTTEAFEERDKVPTPKEAKDLARWFNDYLDRARFQWLDRPKMPAAERNLAETYAKLWTVSLQSNQNTATEYRNQRKAVQEKAIAIALERAGLKYQEKLGIQQSTARRLGGINQVDDVQPNHYVKEQKILGKCQKKQKSDLTIRPTAADKLVL